MSPHLRPTIDEYAMLLASAAALRSEDPSRKVGAVALDHENRVIATAYNGLPSGWDVADDWWQNDDQRRKFVVHAESNLCSLTHRGAVRTVACTTIPCGPCALNLIAHGVKRVVYGLTYPRDVAGMVDPVVRGLTTRGRPEPPQPPITRRIPGLAAIARPAAVDGSSQSLQDFYDAFERFEAGGQALRAYGKGEGLRDLEDARQEYLEEFPPERQATFKAAKKALDDLRDDLADVWGSRTMTPPQKAEEKKAIDQAMVDVARRALGRGGLTRTRFTRRETLAPQARAGVGR
jgi:dCMP deaminase